MAGGFSHPVIKGVRAVNTKILTGGIAGVALLLAYASPALTQEVKLKVEPLSGANEVPPVQSQAKGTAEVTYDPAGKKVNWTVNYSGLSGPATAAHFHGPAERGKNAGVAVPIHNQGTSPVKGSATLTDAQAADLQAGRYYINIHTAANPGGEIRGQVTK